ncbi:MAG: hypothetical protein DSY76_02930, partial [Bacteroidetes bacterium]
MGAEPVGAMLSLCAPAEMSLSVFDGILSGVLFEARRFQCPLVGGNLSRAKECSLTVTIIGRVGRGRALRQPPRRRPEVPQGQHLPGSHPPTPRARRSR